MTKNYRFSYAFGTDVGKKRDHNEDAIFCDQEIGLSIVCDGMGGHAAGEVASRLCCESLASFFKEKYEYLSSIGDLSNKMEREKVREVIRQGVSYGNSVVHQHSLRDDVNAGMGTTLVLLFTLGKFSFVAHVGDSRVYLSRGKNLHQLTEDHSFVNELLRNGAITKEQAKKHPQRNMITRAIGIGKVVTPDILCVELMGGDTFLLCSDGLHDYYNKKKFESVFNNESIEDSPKSFIRYANESGGKDNISVALVQCMEGDRDPQAVSAEKKVDILRDISLFKDMNYKELNQILDLAALVKKEKRDKVVTEGEMSHELYIILKGEYQVTLKNELMAKLSSGDYFGEMSLIDRAPRSASVWSIGESELLAIPREELLGLIRRDPRIGIKLFWSFLHQMNRRLRKSDQQAFEFQKKYNALKEKNKSDPDLTGEYDLGNLLFNRS